MAEIVTVGQDVEGRILGTVRRGDAVAIEALKVMFDAIKPMTPAIRSMTPPLVYDFTEQLLASQRKFAEDVLHLTGRYASTAAK
jgi:hypothetical protein